MSNASKVALGALGLGYLAGAGVGAGEGGDATARADAGAVWDEAGRSYVTGNEDSLTLWRMDAGKVVEATRFTLESRPASRGNRGPDGRPMLFGGGDHVVSKVFTPGPAGRAPAGAMMRGVDPARPRPGASTPRPAPAPLPPPVHVPPHGGQMSCGSGRCG